MAIISCGELPQVTRGAMAVQSISSSVSYWAPSSEGRPRQSTTAASQPAPVGAKGRPARYSNVVSSAAIRPARAPNSTDMLQTVRRPSTGNARIAGTSVFDDVTRTRRGAVTGQ